MKTKRIQLTALCTFLLIGLTACTAENVKFVQDMMTEWANAKGINPTTKDGGLNPEGMVNGVLSEAGRAMNGSSGDREVDAVLDAKDVVDKIRQADNLAETALKTGDVTKIDEAIKQRPNDYSLVNAKGAILQAKGDEIAADRAFSSAYNMLPHDTTIEVSRTGYYRYQRDMLYNMERAWPLLRTKSVNDPSSLGFQSKYCDVANVYARAHNLDRTYLDRANKLGMNCEKAAP